MTALEAFENILKDVVGAKRLSASKMNRLTEIAMKSLEDDTKLVAILYRTHNSLPSSAKVSSLYAFDALARAARSLTSKYGTTGHANSSKGNAATFLLKMAGVLDGLFRDMVSLDNSEAKEKTKKVLDIWVKSNTFPSTVLTRLRDILSEVRKENAVNPTLPTNPPAATEDAMTSQSAPQVSDVQATLLALLGQAAQAQGQGQPPSQTQPNTGGQLELHLALLQQLVLPSNLASGSPTPPPGQTPPPADANSPPLSISASEPSHSFSRPPQPGRIDAPSPGDARYTRKGYPDRARDQRDFRDERHTRGGARGGFRGRGWWDDHHSRDRFRPREQDRNPPLRPRHSRSRSPRRHEEQRNVRPRSPTRRPLHDRGPGHQSELSPPPTTTHGKDEFGRDIRPSSASPSRSASAEDTQTLAPIDSSIDPTAGVAADNHIPVSDPLPLVAASTSAQSTETPTRGPATQQQPGLDRFDIGTFDATAPSSWEALGNMWQTSYGYPPSQEELMQFVMAESMAAAGMTSGGLNGAQGNQWRQGHQEEHGSRYDGGWQGGGYRNTVAEQSDAVVLNGDAMVQDEQDESRSGGRMRRVGDKWMFVKDDESQ